MVAAAGLSCTASLFILAYSCLTLTYGEEDQEVFHHHNSREVVTMLTLITRIPLPSLNYSLFLWLTIVSCSDLFLRYLKKIQEIKVAVLTD